MEVAKWTLIKSPGSRHTSEHRVECTDLPCIYCAAELGFAACVSAMMVRLQPVLIADGGGTGTDTHT